MCKLKGRKSKQMVSNKFHSDFKPFKVRDTETDRERGREKVKCQGAIACVGDRAARRTGNIV